MSKYPGVCITKSIQIRARIIIDGVLIILGSFKTEEQAAELYRIAKRNTHLFDGDKQAFISQIKQIKACNSTAH